MVTGYWLIATGCQLFSLDHAKASPFRFFSPLWPIAVLLRAKRWLVADCYWLILPELTLNAFRPPPKAVIGHLVIAFCPRISNIFRASIFVLPSPRSPVPPPFPRLSVETLTVAQTPTTAQNIPVFNFFSKYSLKLYKPICIIWFIGYIFILIILFI